MAQASISVDQDQFVCPLCLDFLKDPVTIYCGHSFCKMCINDHWDQENQKSVYSCPHCRDNFTQRPILRRNSMLAELMEKLQTIEVQAPSHAHCYAGPGDVECDFCTGRKHKAVKSCLVCVASYCEIHLKPHLERPALKKHTLIKASGKLQEKICSEHDEVLKIYCRTDRTCICYLCMMDKHKGHETVTAAAERAEKQNMLKEDHIRLQKKIQEKQKMVQELKQAVNIIKLNAQTSVDDNERIFTEMISSIEKKRSEVTKLIRDQEKAELSRPERLLEQLEQEISDLQTRITELEQLSHTQDHIHFLQALVSGRQSPTILKPYFHTSSITVHQHLSFDGVRNSLSDLKKRFKEFCEEEFNKIPPQVAAVYVISPQEPQSREDILKYYCYLTLDPNTAHRNLILSEKNREVKYSTSDQKYFDNPNRFNCIWQVLCKESVCGRCYWEVEWRSDGGVAVSVSYKDISRKGRGDECRFGHNNQSWSLWSSSSSLCFYHNNKKTDLEVSSSSRLGVFVDYSAGTLSFYSVSDTMKLLHKVHTTFAQPLYAGFGLYWGSASTVRLCDLNESV
ncbi:tripartite motif-containing protein 16-like [Silurus meridionalis]|uniref:tripartite motif-containing protein 16-like n=1 Tax=Silurus meridionalis TaxID=175797 RepID=UPI001EEAADBF|nr:tripartite motif-containing protein 16-like [Silurus meridionalis]